MDDFRRPPVNRLQQRPSLPTPPLPLAPTGRGPSLNPTPVRIPGPTKPLAVLPIEQPAVVARPKKHRFTRKRKIILGVCGAVAVLLIALAAAYAWFQVQLSPVDSKNTTKQLVTIKDGSTPSVIAKQLKEAGLIRNGDAFLLEARLRGVQSKLQAGTYRLAPSDSTPQIISHIVSGKVDTFQVTFLPGATLADNKKALLALGYSEDQIGQAFAATYRSPLFDGKPATSDLEGYIYGETYTMPSDATVEQILQHTFDEFYKAVQANDLANKFKSQGLTLYEGITLASIVQREASPKGDDMAQIAQVFYKRLATGMPLGSDVTYQYIADKTGQVRSPDLDSPYNTRRYAGLPPGPISAPGEKALIATANPAKTDYLFFLSGDDGVTYFARTLEEHEANRQHCQRKCQIL